MPGLHSRQAQRISLPIPVPISLCWGCISIQYLFMCLSLFLLVFDLTYSILSAYVILYFFLNSLDIFFKILQKLTPSASPACGRVWLRTPPKRRRLPAAPGVLLNIRKHTKSPWKKTCIYINNRKKTVLFCATKPKVQLPESSDLNGPNPTVPFFEE